MSLDLCEKILSIIAALAGIAMFLGIRPRDRPPRAVSVALLLVAATAGAAYLAVNLYGNRAGSVLARLLPSPSPPPKVDGPRRTTATAAVLPAAQPKKPVRWFLVVVNSGAIKSGTLRTARTGILDLLADRPDEDRAALISFADGRPVWALGPVKELPVATGRDQVARKLEALFPSGKATARDGVAAVLQHLRDHPDPARVARVIIAPDHAWEQGPGRPDPPAEAIDAGIEPVRLFTIDFGSEAARGPVTREITADVQARFRPDGSGAAGGDLEDGAVSLHHAR